MAVRCRLLEYWLLEVQILDNTAGSEIKVPPDDVDQLLGSEGGGAVVVHGDGERLGNPDGVAELDKAAAAQALHHQGFGDPPCCVGPTTVHLEIVRSKTSNVQTA